MPFNDNTNIPVLIAWEGVALVFVWVGLYFVRTPAEKILQWDRRTGYWIYHSELKASGDERRALLKAATFYKWFGYFAIGIAGIHVCVVPLILAGKLWAHFSK
jgi:hypothetical protein